MCVVSMVHDYFNRNTQFPQWDWATYAQLKEVLDKLNDLDKRLKQLECTDPSKQKWLADLEAFLLSQKK